MAKIQHKNKQNQSKSPAKKSPEINKVIRNIKNNLKDELDNKKKKIIEKCLNQQANIVIKPVKTKNKLSPKAQTGGKKVSPKNKRKSCDVNVDKVSVKKFCLSTNKSKSPIRKELKVIIDKAASNSAPCTPIQKSPVKREFKVVMNSLTSLKNKSPNKENKKQKKINMSQNRPKLGLLSPKNENLAKSPNRKITAKSREKENICSNQPLIQLTRCDSKKNLKQIPLRVKEIPKKLTKPKKQEQANKMKFKLRIQFKNNKIKDDENVKVKVTTTKKISAAPKIPKTSKINQKNKKDVKNPESKRFKCLFGCNKTFKTLKSRRVHMKNMHKEQLIQCTAKDCDTMLKPQNMQSHIKNAHKKQKIKCPSCQEEVSSLKKHKRLCKNFVETKPFQCTEQGCYVRFETEAGRNVHKAKLHQPPEPCPYKFCSSLVKSSELQSHLKTIHILENFKCEKCSKEMLGNVVYSHLQEKNCVLQAQLLKRI